jgi:MFS family permease
MSYVCIVCWRTVSDVEGTCCGAPMPPAESVIAELRARVARRRDRRAAWTAAGALVLSLALHAALVALGVYQLQPTRGGWGRQGGAGLVGISAFAAFLIFYLLLYFLLRRPQISDDVPSLLRDLR